MALSSAPQQEPQPIHLLQLVEPSANGQPEWKRNVRVIDMDLTRLGFVEHPDGQRARLVPGWPRIADDLTANRITLHWADLIGPHEHSIGVFLKKERRLYIACRVFEKDDLLRHLATGCIGMTQGKADSFPEAKAWALKYYGPLAGTWA